MQVYVECTYVWVIAEHVEHAAIAAGSSRVELDGEADRAAGDECRIAKAANQRQPRRDRSGAQSRNKQIGVTHVVNDERVGERRADKRRAKLKNFAADEVRTAVDTNVRRSDVSGQDDVERAFVRVAAQYVKRATECASYPGIELHGEYVRRAWCNRGVPKAGD